MTLAALQPDSAWAEDRATLRSDPSAVPGAKTDGAARGRPVLHSPHRDWQQSDKPSQQDAVTALARCLSPLANSNRPTFHFPLNQDKRIEKVRQALHFDHLGEFRLKLIDNVRIVRDTATFRDGLTLVDIKSAFSFVQNLFGPNITTVDQAIAAVAAKLTAMKQPLQASVDRAVAALT